MRGRRGARTALLPALALLAALATLLPWPGGGAGDAGGRLYVANLRSSDVTVVDVARGTVVARWAQAPTPHEFAAGAGRLWVSHYRGDLVTGLDPWSGAVLSTVAAGPRPHGLALDGEGAVWVTTADGAIERLGAGGGTGERILVGETPHALVIDGERGRAYVALAGEGAVAAVDLRRGVVVARRAVGALAESIALSADGRTVFVAAADAGRVTALRAQGLVEQWRRALPGRPVRVVAAGERVLVSLAWSGELALLAAESGAVQGVLAVGRLADGIALDASGGYAFVATAGEDTVAMVDLGERRVLAQLPAGQGPSGVFWTAGER